MGLPCIQVDKEENPFLGYRVIRISLQRKDLFMPQLKAILRAGKFGKAAIYRVGGGGGGCIKQR